MLLLSRRAGNRVLFVGDRCGVDASVSKSY